MLCFIYLPTKKLVLFINTTCLNQHTNIDMFFLFTSICLVVDLYERLRKK